MFIGIGSIVVGAGLVGIALAHGLAIAVMVSATAAISGGHLNPAVTFGVWIAKKIPTGRALLFIVAQCVGALAGAWLVSMAIPGEAYNTLKMATPALGPGVSDGQAVLMEAVLTFFLVFVVYETAIDERAPKMSGLFIGLTVSLDILCGGPITGAAMNPAAISVPLS